MIGTPLPPRSSTAATERAASARRSRPLQHLLPEQTVSDPEPKSTEPPTDRPSKLRSPRSAPDRSARSTGLRRPAPRRTSLPTTSSTPTGSPREPRCTTPLRQPRVPQASSHRRGRSEVPRTCNAPPERSVASRPQGRARHQTRRPQSSGNAGQSSRVRSRQARDDRPRTRPSSSPSPG
jgi:hypothetical protein